MHTKAYSLFLAMNRVRKMENKQELKRKYGLFTAIAVVVGSVIGSGIFFRTGQVLNKVGGDIGIGVLSWIISGLIMLVAAFVFSMMAQKYEKVNGLIDYSEHLVSKKYSYYVGWISTTLYTPTISAWVSYVAASYTSTLFGITMEANRTIYLTFTIIMIFVYLVLLFAINFFAPKIAGKFQVSTTFIKLIPLILMGIVGVIIGLINNVSMDDLANNEVITGTSGSLFAGIVTTSYVYDGWISIASLNSEIKNSKRNMPLALLIGSIVIIVAYVIYFLGIAVAGDKSALMENPTEGTNAAFIKVFGSVAAVFLTIFVIVSCVGTTNGNTMSANRLMYSLAVRNWGIMPKTMAKVDNKTDVPRDRKSVV